MPVFVYKAVEANGKRASGSVEAASLQEAKNLLRERRLIILHLGESSSKNNSSLSISKEQLVIFTTQLSSLLSAAVPLYEALQALEEQSKGESHQALITAIRESIRRGASFSDALSKYPESFSALFRAIIVAGESVGRLDSALLRLSQLLTKERQSRQQLISALLYPAILALLLIGALNILVFFVIPAIEGLFEGKTLPAFTQFVLFFAHFIHNNIALLIIGFVACIIGIIYSWMQPKLRSQAICALLTWPIIGPFLIKSALARFSRTLSNLLAGGTPLSSALVYAKEALTNRVLEKEIEQTTQNIIDGETLSSSLLKSTYIPHLFTRMISIGEETGRLGPILGNIAELYEDDSSRLLERAVSLLQPILLITMGVIIGATLLAILLPLADFGSLLQTT
jgi:type II secretory pathway component PulF